MSGQGGYDAIMDIEPLNTPEAQLEFQNFVLSSAEQNLVSGKVSSKPTAASSSSAPNFSIPGPGAPSVNPEQATGTSAFWTLEFYAQFFDVDTNDVVQRITDSVIPRGGFLEKIGSNPDLYGPFWISTTVIFSLFITSSMAGSIYAYIRHQNYDYDMTMLSYAVSSVYFYVTVLPGVIWGLARYFGTPIKFLDLIDLYGYGMTVWIPVSLLCIIPSDLLRWLLIAAAFAISVLFILQNVLPIMSNASNPAARTIVIAVIAGAQGLLALAFRFLFFRFITDINKSPSPDPSPSTSAQLMATTAAL
ncbi:hypothetical protein HDU76_007995 [Blyttiomyces sp. JEL0837]|nr:hypothetical protein HDU76_007995 [Blyttiomyces sp. JEL0837]